MGKLFVSGAWIPFSFILLIGFWKLWVQWRQSLFAATVEYVLLAVDIPKETEQTPKAVENMFAHLAGTYSKLDKYERYWTGKIPAILSFEIISIDGYVQFLIRTPVKHRDLVEAVTYAQYPDAEITEVEDYAESAPRQFPDPEYEMWGTEFVLGKKQYYPIRTYPNFEDKLSQELKDPLSSVLEVMSKLKPGEQLWMQLVLVPIDDTWKEAGEKEARKLVGQKPVVKPTMLGTILEMPKSIISGVVGQVLQPGGTGVEQKEVFPRAMMLTGGERDIIEAIQMKVSKLGFLTKYRVVYLAKKDLLRIGPVVSMVKGCMQQYAALNLNSFKMYGKITPKRDYFYQRWRLREKQRRLMTAYRYRSPVRGAPLYILNTEELATVFHFPSRLVKAPLLKKTEAKRSEPPIGLPVH